MGSPQGSCVLVVASAAEEAQDGIEGQRLRKVENWFAVGFEWKKVEDWFGVGCEEPF